MKITQCHISKSINDFPFRKAYELTEYIDSMKPCVFFGCYIKEDIEVILNHKGLAVIVWCGQDSLDMKKWKMFNKPNIFHVSFMKNVQAFVNKKVPCALIKYRNLNGEEPCLRTLGNKVYVYLPKSHPTYHGEEILKKLKLRHDIVIGGGDIPQDEWRSGKCDEYYDQCFIGLVLSDYAGGGSSIVELGLRGIRCVTNVLDLPNVINWKTAEDIEKAITNESKNIRSMNILLGQQVKNSLDNDCEFLNTEFYGK